MRRRDIIFILLQSFMLLLQLSIGSEFRNLRYRNSYADYLQQNERTAMDTIMDINNDEAVDAVDGVKLREGDIAVSSRSERSCFARSCLWSKSVDGHIYIAYTLSPEYNEVDRRAIKHGMDQIERDTCVRFVPRTHQRDFLDIQSKTGCWSYLGSSGGRQILSLQSPECVSSGVVSHQLMHALGFVHEQSRADRDKYVTIMWSKIWKAENLTKLKVDPDFTLNSTCCCMRRDRVRNFEKFKMNNMDMPYDYGSIMHFGKFAYSEDGDPTIVPKRSWNIKLGQRFGPSELDIMKINKLYKCN
ncbi:hatching enzyme 1.2 [Silurus meridionalis]|uniref:hatching enzyme 1.2 n=1 Tax=Silurus meridionalis TaxID=175797 RepID=UPI001EEB54F4|nr:hatching enzyme 1.2 [Silurus meridionalis]